MTRKQEMLLEFLRECECEAPAIGGPMCPACKYSLQTLTRPVCPECGHELVLTIGAAKHPIGWLLAAIAPGFFSGIAAMFVLIPIFGRLYFGDGRMMGVPIAMDIFGWCSGVFAIVLARKRQRFLAMTPRRQRWFAIIIWLIHVAALGLFILIASLFA